MVGVFAISLGGFSQNQVYPAAFLAKISCILTKRCRAEVRGVLYSQPRGIQEKGRRGEGSVSYMHPGREFLCEMKAEQVRDCVTL